MTSKLMQPYHDLLRRVLEHGENVPDRTGVGTRRVFGHQLRFDLREGFPAITTKQLAWRAVVSELLWFLEGSGDERRLAEILHGSRDTHKSTIWTANAQAPYWQDRARYPGDLGKIYGCQWRNWRGVDQIHNLVNGLKNAPHSRRHILTAWNVDQLDQMALPPCHILSQFFVSQAGELSCQMYQRSADLFLGVPFNIASYALLTHLLAHALELEVGELILVTGDTHIYASHFDQVREQLSRDHLSPPTLRLTAKHRDITMFKMDEIHLDNYESHGPIPAPMAV